LTLAALLHDIGHMLDVEEAVRNERLGVSQALPYGH
jgi:HD superfamily phosphodiesterase